MQHGVRFYAGMSGWLDTKMAKGLMARTGKGLQVKTSACCSTMERSPWHLDAMLCKGHEGAMRGAYMGGLMG